MRGVIDLNIQRQTIHLYDGDKYLGCFKLKPGVSDSEDFYDLLETRAETLIDPRWIGWNGIWRILDFDPYTEDIRQAIARLKVAIEFKM